MENSLNRKPLLIYGARQIGKTYSMLEFGKEHYANVVYCNFENTMDLHTILREILIQKELFLQYRQCIILRFQKAIL